MRAGGWGGEGIGERVSEWRKRWRAGTEVSRGAKRRGEGGKREGTGRACSEIKEREVLRARERDG